MKIRMDGLFQRLDLFFLSWVFLFVEAQTGQIPAPENVSLQWVDGFYPQLSWAAPPPGRLNNSCIYEVAARGPNGEIDSNRLELSETSWNPYVETEGRSLTLSTTVVCGNRQSETTISIAEPELVRDLECYIETPGRAHCSWLPVNNATDLRFFYWIQRQDRNADGSPKPMPLQECLSYSKNGDRVGCDLQAQLADKILVLFNRTLNATVARNTFRRAFKDDVRPPPLNWTVTHTEDHLIIQWVPPALIDLDQWNFTINFTVCENKTYPQAVSTVGRSSVRLSRLAHCPYSLKIKAHTKDGDIPWSDEKHIDADKGSNGLVYAAFLIPLLIAILLALAFMFYRKNKDTIFPKVPEPRDFLSDICDNNNKVSVCNLYCPVKVEDDCKITLVIDPNVNKL